MSLIDRVLNEPEFHERPPVLVDVGAAGGVSMVWQQIARYSVGVGFEPDARESAALTANQTEFRRWIHIPSLAVAAEPVDGEVPFNLTRSPQCSSTLDPNFASLQAWAYADLFDVVEKRNMRAESLVSALRSRGLDRIDWLKCDSQGMDLRLYLSLSQEMRRSMTVVEFEPGLIEAYDGEDSLADILAEMRREPFWIATLEVQRTQRGRLSSIRKILGARQAHWFRRFGVSTPGWVNLAYLRDHEKEIEALNRRSFLLGWLFATMLGQSPAAMCTAAAGLEQFGGDLFSRLVRASAGEVRRGMLSAAIRGALRRIFLR